MPRSAAPGGLAFHPATPERWNDVTALFGPHGACAGCWCMWPRLTGAAFRASDADQRKKSLRKVIDAGDPPGLIAYRDGAPVGWCALAPRAAYPRLEGSRVMAPVDDTPVWSVVCFFVARGERGQGLARDLLAAAMRHAAARGARVLEGYPIDRASRTGAAFIWTGVASTFRALGFTEVARRSPTRPVMRKTLRAAATVARPKPPAARQAAPTVKPAARRAAPATRRAGR